MDKHALDPACLLGDRLQTLSRAELTALAEALCRILAERGTYHGGIRPDNISRAADGTVGLGAPARTDTKDWTTEELEFMAPEVFWSGHARRLGRCVFARPAAVWRACRAAVCRFTRTTVRRCLRTRPTHCAAA